MSNTKEMVVIPKENMKHLSLPTQKLVNELSNELDVEKLTELNPLVETMIIIEGFKDLKFDKEDDVSILNFKEAKSTIRSFNSATRKAKGVIKKPILETGRKVDKIEKVFLERAKAVLVNLEKEFKPYLDEEEKKKEERIAKKNKAATDKIEALSDEAVQQKKVIERGKLYSKLQTEISGYVPEAVKQATTFSKPALTQEIEGLKELKSVGYVLQEDEKAILLEEQQEEIQNMFTTNIDSAIHILQTAFEKPEVTHVPGPSHNLGDTLTMGQIPQSPLPSEPLIQMVAPSLTQVNPDYFKSAMCDIISEAIEAMERLDPANEKETQVKNVMVESFTKSKEKVINFLSDGQ